MPSTYGGEVMADEKKLMNRIAIQPDVHFGKPCIKGTRITVENVLDLVEQGIPFPKIIKDYYPDLDADDIRACIHYASKISV
jgi:uncharacterized protein (DUF433 family)